jgi:YD repeat-containing protein
MQEVDNMGNASMMNPIAVENQNNYVTNLDYDSYGNLIYMGKAIIGSTTNASSWQIKKLTYDALNNLTKISWAGGNESFKNIWDNRTTLSYS